MSSSFPNIMSYEDVTVVPFTHLLDWRKMGPRHVGGPIWPDWDDIPLARHFLGDAAADTRPEPQVPQSVQEGEKHFWIGPIYAQFGHQIAELSTRILPSLIAEPEATLVFSAKDDGKFLRLENTPEFFRAILDWYEVPPERVLIVDRPTLFRRLRVAAQPERLFINWSPRPEEMTMAAPEPAYVEAQTAHARTQLRDPERRGLVLVSRSTYRLSIAGETELDVMFERAGARIFRPERVPLREQLATYASAETLVFTAGSAAIGLQLLGRNIGNVIEIRRQPEGVSHREVSIPPRAESFALIEVIRGMITGVNRDNAEIPQIHGMALLDIHALMSQLAANGVDLRPHFDARRFAAAEASDLRTWLGQSGALMLRLDRRSRLAIARSLLKYRPSGWFDILLRLASSPMKRRLRRILRSAPA